MTYISGAKETEYRLEVTDSWHVAAMIDQKHSMHVVYRRNIGRQP